MRVGRQIGIVGTGAMGGPMAQRLMELGHTVHIHDGEPDRVAEMRAAGAVIAPDAATVAAETEVVLIVVVTADQCAEVISGEQGLAEMLSPGQCVLFCPTIAPESARSLAESVAQAGGQAIDAPISGGPKRARTGELSMMLAASPATIADAQPLIDDLATQQFVVSETVGDASAAKLLNNLAGGINLVAAMEVMAAASRLGLDPGVLPRILAASSGQSWVADDRIPRAMAGDLQPRAALSVLTKDLTLAQQMLAAVDETSELGAAALAAFKAAVAAGWQDHDDAALYQWMMGEDPGTHPLDR